MYGSNFKTIFPLLNIPLLNMLLFYFILGGLIGKGRRRGQKTTSNLNPQFAWRGPFRGKQENPGGWWTSPPLLTKDPREVRDWKGFAIQWSWSDVQLHSMSITHSVGFSDAWFQFSVLNYATCLGWMAAVVQLTSTKELVEQMSQDIHKTQMNEW